MKSFFVVGYPIFNNGLFELAQAYVDGETLIETENVGAYCPTESSNASDER